MENNKNLNELSFAELKDEAKARGLEEDAYSGIKSKAGLIELLSPAQAEDTDNAADDAPTDDGADSEAADDSSEDTEDDSEDSEDDSEADDAAEPQPSTSTGTPNHPSRFDENGQPIFG